MRNLCSICLCLGLVGCASMYSQDRDNLAITVVNNTRGLPRDCKKIREIEGISYLDPQLAMIDLRDKAVLVSATHVVLTEAALGFWSSAYTGTAYQCPDELASAPCSGLALGPEGEFVPPWKQACRRARLVANGSDKRQ